MTSKKRCLLILVTVVGSGIFIILWLVSLRSGITKSNYDRIQEGMTLQEVEDILGPEQADVDWAWVLQNGVVRIGHTQRVWATGSAGIRIHFDEQGKVAVKQWVPHPQGFWERIRQWFRL